MQNYGARSTKLLQAIQKTIETTLEANKNEERNENIKADLQKLFGSYFNETLLQKLDLLDKQLEEKRINLRSVKCDNYIKEILESYIVDEKIDKIGFFDKKISEEIVKKESLVKTIEELNNENIALDKEITEQESKVSKLVEIVNTSK